MKWIREHTHIVDHPRLLEAGPQGRDLWHWGLLYAGLHETDGELPMVALMASPWGAGGKRNVVVAKKLVDVGLWERTDTGYRICRWTQMGNPSKAELEEKRREERDGRKTRRKRSSGAPIPASDVVSDGLSGADTGPDPGRTPQGVPYSDSYSYSESGSGSDRATPIPPPPPPPPAARPSQVHELADPMKPPPDWWESVCGTIAFQTGEKLPAGEAWLRYAGHRGEKRGAPERGHATYWLTTVMVREAREDREKARQQADRQTKFDREREKARDAAGAPQPYHQVIRPPPSAEQRASPAEQAAAMKRLTEAMFKPGKTGS